MRSLSRANCLAASLAVASGLLLAPAAYAKVRVVHSGDSIQAAIDAADPGDTILIEPGTYRESLLINDKDGLTLRGKRATLTNPATAPSTPCNQGGSVVGICVIGQGNFDTGQITDRVSDVRITHLKISRMAGDGIFAFGSQNLRVDHDRLVRNHGYGAFSLASYGTRFLHNLARGNAAPGLYVGDSPDAHAHIEHNASINNHGEGILLRSATIGEVSHNRLSGNCSGLWVLADAPGPAGGFRITRNRVLRNNKACAGEPDEGEPPASGIGIALIGAFGTVVSRNEVTGNRPSGPSVASGGIIVQKGGSGTAPSNDVVKRNEASNNSPKDISWDGSGTVRFKNNSCGSSAPSGLC
jgi:nitrous oxidase accessory protein NosD